MSRPHSPDPKSKHNRNRSSRNTMRLNLPPRPPSTSGESRNRGRSPPRSADAHLPPPPTLRTEPSRRPQQDNLAPPARVHSTSSLPRFPSALRLKTQPMNSKRQVDYEPTAGRHDQMADHKSSAKPKDQFERRQERPEAAGDEPELELEEWKYSRKRRKMTRVEKRQLRAERETKVKAEEEDDGWEKDIEAALEEDISAWEIPKLDKEGPADQGEPEDAEPDEPEPPPPTNNDDTGFKLVYKPRPAANPLIRPPKRPRPSSSTTTTSRAHKPPRALEPVPSETLATLTTLLDDMLTAFHTDDSSLLNTTLETLSWTLTPPTITASSLTALSIPTHLRTLLSSPLSPSIRLSISLLLDRWSSQIYTPNPSSRFPRRGTYGYPSQQPGHMHFPLGIVFPAQYDAFLSGIHPSPEAGITGMSLYGAYSIVLSHSSYDDRDEGEELLYTGTVSTSLDPTRGTELMSTSRRLGTPVRVLRSSKHGGSYSPTFGLRYDGLYRVVDEEAIEAGRNRRFRLRRCRVGNAKLENQIALKACLTRPTKGEVKWLEGVLEERRKKRGEMKEAREGRDGVVF